MGIGSAAEELREWLLSPLKEGWPVRMWHVCAAACAAAAVFLILLILHLKKRKERRSAYAPTSGERAFSVPVVTLRPSPEDDAEPHTEGASADRETTLGAPAKAGDGPSGEGPLLVANLQGLGERSEQQDAFGISPLAEYEKQGLFAVLCDGMGGMKDGRAIAVRCVTGAMRAFPFRADEESRRGFERSLNALNEEIYGEYEGSGGATLVAVYLFDGKLWFWCAGDSDLLLIRGGRLYRLNEHQEYQVQRLRQAVRDVLSFEDAFHSPQGGALTGFMGCRRLEPETNFRPLPLQRGDVLVLCSDGVSDTLSQKEILDAVSVPSPEKAAAHLEREIRRAMRSGQDNYTAIICRYNGPVVRTAHPEREVWIPQV